MDILYSYLTEPDPSVNITCYATLVFSFASIAAFRTRVAALGDLGTTVHLNGRGWLSKKIPDKNNCI